MRFILLTLVMTFGLIIPSCINDDFTDSPSATLTFSTDTVSFGTVFTDLGSPTMRLLVHNRNKQGVMISSIRFRDGQTPFRLNVDGVSGDDFHDVEIGGGDSIYLFIECFVDATPDALPFKVSDCLEFVTNGVMQEVVVEATAQNVVRLRSVRVESEMTLTSGMPYVVTGTLEVAEGATLRVEPGARVYFHDQAGMEIRGTLLALGSAEKKIDFCGDRVDDILPGVGYDVMSGQWEGIRILPESFGNKMEYVDMRSSSVGLSVDSCGDMARSKLQLVNSWLHNSSSKVLESRYSKVDAYGCCFSESPYAVVSLTGGDHEFVQCTIANNYLFSAVTEANLSLFHYSPSDKSAGEAPLMRASFENSIIWGIGKSLNSGDLSGSDVRFNNVLLKGEERGDENFEDCLWNADPLFLTVREDYYFNYHVQPGSPALGAGNPVFVNLLTLYDMDGDIRLPAPTSLPALGAYAVPALLEPEK